MDKHNMMAHIMIAPGVDSTPVAALGHATC